MRHAETMIEIGTSGPGLTEFTPQVLRWVEQKELVAGLLTLFIRHTSASLLIQENADRDVRADLEDFFARLVPEKGPYRHTDEGPDDMPAHIKAALLPQTLTIPISKGRLALGLWQGLYVFEHRTSGRRRSIALSYLGT